MTKVNLTDLKTGQVVYYIPNHLKPSFKNSERGVVSTIKENQVWVRYTYGETGALTPLDNLYKA